MMTGRPMLQPQHLQIDTLAQLVAHGYGDRLRHLSNRWWWLSHNAHWTQVGARRQLETWIRGQAQFLDADHLWIKERVQGTWGVNQVAARLSLMLHVDVLPGLPGRPEHLS